MSYGVPFMLVMLPITWWVLCRVTLPFQFDGGTRESIRAAIGVMGTMGAPEKRVVAVVSLVALAWVFQPFVERHVTGITDAGIAIAGALLLALLPSGASGPGRPRTLLEWDDAKRAPWYLILLLGGGLALADAVVKSGLSAWLAQALGVVSDLPLLPMLLAIALLCALITEAASNVATATIFMPIAASLALGIAIPVWVYAALRRVGGFSGADAAALAAHYGAVSSVTFIAALAYVQRLGMPAEGFMPAMLPIMDVTAIVIGLSLAREARAGGAWRGGGCHAGAGRRGTCCAALHACRGAAIRGADAAEAWSATARARA
jgi:Na+/H+ antiporter NhaD/arsenite permease-like protein